MMTPQITRLARFFIVGASGVVVNMGVLIFLKEKLGIHYAVASLIAIELSILSNFVLNNSWTWSDRRNGTLAARLLKYHVVAGFTAFAANWVLLVILTQFFGLDYRISNLIGIGAGTVLNFFLNHKWTFRKHQGEAFSISELLDPERIKEGLAIHGISSGWKTVLVVLIFAVIILRLVAMVWMPLVPEEAYYWMYSQHPGLSYFDHPPMVAWLIGLGTQLFGNTEFGVRAGIGLMMLASSGLIYIFGRMWFNRESAAISAMLLLILPLYFGTGLIATMDSALLFFWLICMLGVSVALRDGKKWGWYLAGFGLGGAILSKYTGIFLGLGALLCVVGYKPWRKYLLSPHPYLATALAFAMFTPVILWNSENDWASFRFQFMNRFHNETVNLSNVVSFIGLQIGAATPLVLPILLWLLARTFLNKRRLLTPRMLVAMSFSLPLLGVMAYKSLKSDIHLNWTLPAYLSAMPAAAELCLASWRLARRKNKKLFWRQAALATAAICLCLNIIALTYVLVLQPRLGWFPALGPWRGLAAAVEKVHDQLKSETGKEPLIIGTDKYQLASILAFYRAPMETKVRTSEFTTSGWILTGSEGLGYVYWMKKEPWIGSDCIFVNDADVISLDFLFAIKKPFERYEIVDTFHQGHKTYQIAIGHSLNK